MDATRVYRLRNAVQHYAWGSRTAIPELLGEPSPADMPCAELWMGAHPKAPSEVLLPEGPMGLDDFVAADPEAVLGAAVVERFGGRLPFLVKVLAADSPLSIQAHPNREQAREGFDRENRAGIALDAPDRCYVDASHKPELICALGHFQALNRFRRPEEVLEHLGVLGASELARSLDALRGGPDREGLAALFRGLWRLSAGERRSVLGRASEVARARSDLDPAWRWVADLGACYPDDIGVLAPLLLNLVVLEPGQAMYLPVGELHSYLRGVGIEVMASSDNVLRGGLTSKHVDVPELLRTLTFESGPVEVVAPRAVGGCEVRYDTPAEEFSLARIDVAPGRVFEASPARPVEILLCTSGSGTLRLEEALRLRRGDSILIPAAAGAYRIEGGATLYRASVGRLRRTPDASGPPS